ncbi:MAG: TraR/DksA C4-type zinc finger protein [Methylophilaceae bacterium]|nr:TraR/DksA C4-type zinc finger protein [Methylophilaceae bacterium]
MPTLNQTEKQRIAEVLKRRHRALCDEIHSELERSGHQHYADLAGEVADAGDASVADMLVDQDIAIVRRQVEELTQVEAAQQRLMDDDFGTCEDCGADIGLPRLLAVPHATRCIACQEQHEKTYAHEANPKM